MQINCTVIVQIINFIVTYTFLRKFFLRSTTNLVLQKRTAKKIMFEKLKLKELAVQNLIIKKNKDLEDFKQLVKQKYKKPDLQLAKIEENVLGRGMITDTSENVSECTRVIIKEMTNAF